jgi:hypothetical protein
MDVLTFVASSTAASGGGDWLSNLTTLVVGVVGIVVSGERADAGGHAQGTGATRRGDSRP